MKIADAKVGAVVVGIAASDENKAMIGTVGRIIDPAPDKHDSRMPLVRFNRNVGGHGRNYREWFCLPRHLRLITAAPTRRAK